MAGFFIPEFAGMMPRRDARLLETRYGQSSLNTELFSGALRSFHDVSATTVTPTKVGTKKTIYRYGQDVANEAQYWFHFLVDADIARAPINNDAAEITCWTGEAEPRITDSGIALVGGTDYPMNWYKLGIPKPAAAPGLASNGAGAGDPVNLAAIYTYVGTVGGIQQEGPPSDPSVVIAAKNGDLLSTTGMSVGPGAGYNITAKRIYLIVSGNANADAQFFAEVAVGTVNDNNRAFQQANLTEVIKSRTWTPPPAALKGLTVVSGSFLAGFENNDVRLSEAGLPHAWPYRKSLPFGVVGFGTFDRNLVALTKGNPYAGTASDPATMVTGMVKIADGKACVAKRGIVNFSYGTVYPCADGLGLISPGGFRLVTDEFFTRREWQALKPESFSSYRWGTRYVGFYDNGAGTQRGFIFDPANPQAGFVYISPYATAGYNDPLRDELYLQIGNDIKKWDGGAGYLQQTHRSKVFTMPRPINPSVAQVIATAYPVTMRLYADGVLKHTQAVANADPFKLPDGYVARDFEVELEHATASAIRSVAMAESVRELKDLVT